MRIAILVVGAALLLAACGGTKAPAPAQGPKSIRGAEASTIGAGTARFTLTVSGTIGGMDVGASERGAVAFKADRAHIYKLVTSGGLPEELIVDGPFQYTNGNVQAAMYDTRVRPWTKLDTRRLTEKQRLASAGELAHVRAPVYLIGGVREATDLGPGPGGTTRFRGTVVPALVAARAPAALRAGLATAVHNDYAAKPFAAEFWLDAHRRVRRVHVSYQTAQGGRISVDATYSSFGAPVPLKLPPPDHVKDITP